MTDNEIVREQVKFKRLSAGTYESSNGWRIQKDYGWAGLWDVCRNGKPPEGKRWKTHGFVQLQQAKAWIVTRQAITNRIGGK